jgi:hypothetical protein
MCICYQENLILETYEKIKSVDSTPMDKRPEGNFIPDGLSSLKCGNSNGKF